jgi:3-isopropylmalate/(R)-2-methylmalate dehydratase small subunit
MGTIVTGKVWKFGDNISTDYMSPMFTKQAPWEEQKKYILHIHKVFAQRCQPGDVIVAGKNFGCGSSRESAPDNLKRLGIGCVIAESFGRIFYRNCIAIGLPVMAHKGISDIFNEGDLLELDFEQARVKNLTTDNEVKGMPLVPDLINILKNGGILALLKSESKLTT